MGRFPWRGMYRSKHTHARTAECIKQLAECLTQQLPLPGIWLLLPACRKNNMSSLVPVSYTHLTLPTKA